MDRKLLIALSLAVAVAAAGVCASLCATTSAMASGSGLAGPGPGITGNYTGGIVPYQPAPAATYRQMAEDFCGRYGRRGIVTSIHRIYGDYVSFVCYDHPGVIH
jgi:hypothetical protein